MSMSNKFLTNVVAASAETIYKNYKSMTAVLNHLEHNKMKPKPRLHSHRAIGKAKLLLPFLNLCRRRKPTRKISNKISGKMPAF